VPELRSDVGLQLRRRGAGPEAGLAAFVFVQALAALVYRDHFDVLTWWTRETWLLLILLWAKNLLLAFLAAALVVLAFRFTEGAGAASWPGWTPALVGSAAAALVLGTALRWVWPSLIPPAQFCDTFTELEPVLRDPLGIPWIGTTPWPGASHEQISNLYARVTHASVVAFGGGAEGLLSVAALPGTLLLPAMLWLGLEAGGPAVGVIALSLAAFAAWPLNVARWGHEGSAVLPLLTAGLAGLLAGHRTGRVAWGLFAGACLGFSLHTHPAAWATVGALALWGIFRLASVPAERRLVAAAAIAGALALAPFAWGFVRMPSRLGGHLRDVNLRKVVRDVSAPAGAGGAGLARRLAYNALHYTAIFTGAADPNPRHGLTSAAKLPLLAGLAALLGAAAAFRTGAPTAERALLVFAGGTVLAGVLSDPGAAPNSFRVCALVPPLLVWAARSLRAFSVRAGPFVRARPGLIAALAVSALIATDTVPFLASWPFDAGVAAAFDTGETEAGRLLGLVGSGNVALDPGAVRHPIVIETVARRVSPQAAVPDWPVREPREMSGTGAGWYVSEARRLAALCAFRRCGRPIRLDPHGRALDLVRLGP
jgi:hypothetical protein